MDNITENILYWISVAAVVIGFSYMVWVAIRMTKISRLFLVVGLPILTLSAMYVFLISFPNSFSKPEVALSPEAKFPQAAESGDVDTVRPLLAKQGLKVTLEDAIAQAKTATLAKRRYADSNGFLNVFHLMDGAYRNIPKTPEGKSLLWALMVLT